MRKQKRNKLPTTKLVKEICLEILVKLPIKAILRFRCVSKLWCSLIDDLHFTSTHLKNQHKLQDESRLLVLEPHEMCDRNQLGAIRRSDTFRRMSKHEFGDDWSIHYHATGYINGVLCVKKYITAEVLPVQIFLWNPSIRKALEIPLPRAAKSKAIIDNIDCAFGFDPITNDYKIVASLYIRGEHHFPKFVEIYTLSKNSWKFFEKEKYPILWDKYRPKAYLNGIIYWMGIDLLENTPKGKFSHLVSFNVDKEALNYIDLPDCEIFDDPDHERFPIVLDQSIAIMDIYPKYTSIWAMRENSWFKRYTINLQLFQKCVFLKSNGNLLHRGEQGGVSSYHLESTKVKGISKSYKVVSYFTSAYMESLVLLNGFDDRNVFTFPNGEKNFT
ncbi:putative F-box protein At1g32420 [Silene latifolia]|uniref:putative F-box protein At1g32420 n=1 Tax=Silene latifolia TaxID=37657 RepID=UPI003D776662